MIRLNILSETKALEGYGAEHGLSFLVEADGKSFLFDTGASDLFMRNAALMGIDPNQAEAVVLSHGHFDHGDGLPYLERNTLVCHPGCFVKRYRKLGFGNIGISLSEASAGKRFDLVPSRDPLWLTEHLLFLGEIPRENAFEAQATPYILEDGTKDFIYDDSGLACVTEGGLVVVSGCAHSGICNMITHALRVTGEDRVKAVIGGFHLRERDRQLQETIAFLEALQPGAVYPSHCTRDPALSAFHEVFGSGEVAAGSTITF